MLDFRTETFLTICKYMNYTAAAQKLNITQPAVTQHVRFLEEYYGAKLFVYEHRKLKLTKAGEILRQALSTSINDERYLKDKIKSAGILEMQLNFGVTRTIGEYVIGHPLALFLRNHSEYKVNMKISNTSNLLDHIIQGEINFAIVEGYFDRIRFESEILKTEAFIPVCSVKHEFRKKIDYVADLFAETLLIREDGSGTREIMEKHLMANNYSLDCFHNTITIGGMHTILQLIEEDMGITFLFQSAAQELIDAGVIKEIVVKDFNVFHEYAFIWEKGSKYGDEYRNICEEFKKCLNVNENNI